MYIESKSIVVMSPTHGTVCMLRRRYMKVSAAVAVVVGRINSVVRSIAVSPSLLPACDFGAAPAI